MVKNDRAYSQWPWYFQGQQHRFLQVFKENRILRALNAGWTFPFPVQRNVYVKWPEEHKDTSLLKIGCVYLLFILRNDRKTKKYKTRHRETQERFSFYNLSLFSHCISVSFQQKWQNSYEYQKICKSAFLEETLWGVLITFYINTSASTSCRKIGSLKKSWCQSVFYDDFH